MSGRSMQTPGSPTGASDRGGASPRGHTPRALPGLYDSRRARRGSGHRDELRGSQIVRLDGGGDEDVEEEIDAVQEEEKEFDAFQLQEYQARLKELKGRGHTIDKRLQKSVISAQPDGPDEFSQEAVDMEVGHILADPKGIRSSVRPDGTLWWSSESDECREFRELMRQSAESDERDWCKMHGRSVQEGKRIRPPPKYFAVRLKPAQRDQFAATVQISVMYCTQDGFCESDRVCCDHIFAFRSSCHADSAVGECVAHFNRTGGFSPPLVLESHVLKVRGKADYLYGPAELIDFVYIRSCLQKKQKAECVLVRMDCRREDEHQQIRYRYPNLLPSSLGSCCAHKRRSRVQGMSQHLTTHNELSVENRNAHRLKQLSLWDIRSMTEITVKSVASMRFTLSMLKEHNLVKDEDSGEDMYVCVVGQLVHGQRELCRTQSAPWRVIRDPVATKQGVNFHNAVWGRSPGTLRFGVRMCHLPREVRLCMTVVACPQSGLDRVSEQVKESSAARLLADDVQGHKTAVWRKVAGLMTGLDEREEALPVVYLGWVNFQLFDHRGLWRAGEQCLRMWQRNDKANPIGVVSTSNDPNAMTVNIELPEFARPVRFPCGQAPEDLQTEMDHEHRQRMRELEPWLRDNAVNQLRRVRKVVQSDPLYQLDDVDKHLLWQFRHDLTVNFRALPKFLQAVRWDSPAAVSAALHLLHHPNPEKRWKPPPPGEEMMALELLGARYASGVVREYALDILTRLDDAQLADCILQLVQVLKYEPYHYSALARFLLRRSMMSPHQIGHFVFWHLKAEMYNPQVSERHGLLIEEYLRRSPYRRSLVKQAIVTQQLLHIALEIKDQPKQERLAKARDALDKLELPPTFLLPLDPRLECAGLVVTKCRVMDSKKLPLWTVFRNADPQGKNILVIFKAGDDLRQDLLTLQMINMFDTCWKAEGLDLHMSPYGCIATDDGVGYIEVVTSSETIAEITRKAGGAPAAFRPEPMRNWLRQQQCNKTEDGARKCTWNFLYSCAGYCVATYILGIGDRHNDNIMMKHDGTLFHIDFGHFLGNFKTKFGFKRETAPFIFTPMYAHVLGGEKSPIYKHYVQVACKAYNCVRRLAHIIIALFALMLSTGIPELQKPDDIEWLRTVLVQDMDDGTAAERYQEKIKESLQNKRAVINDYIHIVAH